MSSPNVQVLKLCWTRYGYNKEGGLLIRSGTGNKPSPKSSHLPLFLLWSECGPGLLFYLSQRGSFPSVGVCRRRNNPPWSQNPNRANMKGKCNYPASFRINWTPPPISEEVLLLIRTRPTRSACLCFWVTVRENPK